MRVPILIAAATLTLLGQAPAQAATYYPWCAWYDWSTSNCGFTSYRQCLATISGVGGECRRNVAEPGPSAARRPAPVQSYGSPAPRSTEPARMIQLPNGRWISSYGCVTDEGYGRYRDCGLSDHD